MFKFKYPFIIGEAGSNFNQNFNNAKKLIKTAKSCGADAVKFQLFNAKKLYPDNIKMQKIFLSMQLNKNWIPKLIQYSKKINIHFFLSIFDSSSLSFIKKYNLDLYKIASSEVTNFELLKRFKNVKQTILLSTGMSDLDDVYKAVKIIKKKVVIMQCCSIYPLPIKETNLLVLNQFKKKFPNCILGFSDHTESDLPAIVAVGLGAKVFEKHITLNKKSKGLDHKYAYEPMQFKKYVKNIREAFTCLGSSDKNLLYEEKKYGRRNGIYLSKNLKKNTILKRNMIKFMSPAIGIRDKFYKSIIGKKLKLNLKKNDALFKYHIK